MKKNNFIPILIFLAVLPDILWIIEASGFDFMTIFDVGRYTWSQWVPIAWVGSCLLCLYLFLNDIEKTVIFCAIGCIPHVVFYWGVSLRSANGISDIGIYTIYMAISWSLVFLVAIIFFLGMKRERGHLSNMHTNDKTGDQF